MMPELASRLSSMSRALIHRVEAGAMPESADCIVMSRDLLALARACEMPPVNQNLDVRTPRLRSYAADMTVGATLSTWCRPPDAATLRMWAIAMFDAAEEIDRLRADALQPARVRR